MTIEKIANALPDAILVLNTNDELQWWNSAAEQLFPKKIFPKTNPESLIGKEHFAQCKTSETPIEVRVSNHRYLACTLKPYIDNQRLLILQDVSRTHHLERMRQDFVGNVSHELRTPLTVIHGFLEILTSQTHDKKTLEIFDQMQQQSIRMQKIIEELLFLARLENLEHEEMDKQLIDVPSLLETIHQDARKLSKNQHEFTFVVDKNLKLNGIPEEIHSLFSNLIFNAVKYTPSQGKITIRWQMKNKKPTFEVIDTGIGIEKKHLARITERFYRVDKGRSTGGTGLGLAIVKHILIHHHAKLEIESEPNQGSRFCCVF